jgi:hypothetical protein
MLARDGDNTATNQPTARNGLSTHGQWLAAAKHAAEPAGRRWRADPPVTGGARRRWLRQWRR